MKGLVTILIFIFAVGFTGIGMRRRGRAQD